MDGWVAGNLSETAASVCAFVVSPTEMSRSPRGTRRTTHIAWTIRDHGADGRGRDESMFEIRYTIYIYFHSFFLNLWLIEITNYICIGLHHLSNQHQVCTPSINIVKIALPASGFDASERTWHRTINIINVFIILSLSHFCPNGPNARRFP